MLSINSSLNSQVEHLAIKHTRGAKIAPRRPYPNRTITGTPERQRTLAPSLTLARRHTAELGKTPPQHNISAPHRTPPPSHPQHTKKPPPPQLVAAKGVVFIYELDQKA